MNAIIERLTEEIERRLKETVSLRNKNAGLWRRLMKAEQDLRNAERRLAELTQEKAA